MSHTIRITNTTSTTTTSAIFINTGYLKTTPGILKLLQTLLGIAVVGILSYYHNVYASTNYLFFLLMAVTFLVGTFLLLVSCLISLSTGSIISKTSYEVVYHGAAFIMYLAASIAFLVELNRYGKRRDYEALMAASIMGLVIAGLYLFSTILAQRTYRVL